MDVHTGEDRDRRQAAALARAGRGAQAARGRRLRGARPSTPHPEHRGARRTRRRAAEPVRVVGLGARARRRGCGPVLRARLPRRAPRAQRLPARLPTPPRVGRGLHRRTGAGLRERPARVPRADRSRRRHHDCGLGRLRWGRRHGHAAALLPLGVLHRPEGQLRVPRPTAGAASRPRHRRQAADVHRGRPPGAAHAGSRRRRRHRPRGRAAGPRPRHRPIARPGARGVRRQADRDPGRSCGVPGRRCLGRRGGGGAASLRREARQGRDARLLHPRLAERAQHRPAASFRRRDRHRGGAAQPGALHAVGLGAGRGRARGQRLARPGPADAARGRADAGPARSAALARRRALAHRLGAHPRGQRRSHARPRRCPQHAPHRVARRRLPTNDVPSLAASDPRRPSGHRPGGAGQRAGAASAGQGRAPARRTHDAARRARVVATAEPFRLLPLRRDRRRDRRCRECTGHPREAAAGRRTPARGSAGRPAGRAPARPGQDRGAAAAAAGHDRGSRRRVRG